MEKLLNPKIDFVFKRIFGSEENKDILLSFLNATLRLPLDKQLTWIEILNPTIDKDAIEDKQSILDIRARTKNNTQINIEIQLHNKYDIEKRTLYYWAKMYEEQLIEGMKYKELRKTITINILDFNYLPNEHCHSVFRLREDTTHKILTEDIEIHFIELNKIEQQPYNINDPFGKWLVFIKGVQKEKWEEIAMGDPIFQKAMTTLEFLSQDREMRRLYEMRRKAILDERSMLEGAKEEGWEKGREEGREVGRQEGKIEVAKNLLTLGLSIQQIAQATGLTVEEVTEIKK